MIRTDWTGCFAGHCPNRPFAEIMFIVRNLQTVCLYLCSSNIMSGGVNVICCNIMCYVCIVTQVKIHVTRLKQDVTLRKMRVSCREFIFGDTFYICV